MAVIGLVWLFATATLTYAAGEKLATPAKAPVSVATPRPTLVVPDIRGQAFVFAKGILEESGFAWRVRGSVQGYSTNVVSSQQPAAGTRLEDTGAPTLTLTMRRGTYPQAGMPENTSPYAGTSLVLPKSASAPAKRPTVRKTVARAKTAAKPAAKRARHGAAKPKRKIARTKPTARGARPSAFVVPGAPKEPLDEIALTVRARRLSAWLTQSRRPTAANERYWLYQHAWIVTGAKFGWWHGAAALRVLINVDRRVQSQWGIGFRSESVARGALAAAEASGK
jgi:PASTA domain